MPTFDSFIQRFGLPGGSLNLRDAVDVLPPGDYQNLVNVDPIVGPIGGLTGRPGQTALLTGGTQHHSIFRLSDPLNGTFTRLVGFDTSLGYGTSGALTTVATGLSGDGLTFAAARPPLSGATYAYIGDSAKMVKYAGGNATSIGIPFPTNAVSASLDSISNTTIEAMNATTGWTGTGLGGAASPTLSTTTDAHSHTALLVTTNASSSSSAYINAAYKAITVDLSSYADSDYINLEVMVDKPDHLTEVKVYLSLGSFTGGGIVPGWSTSQNTDAYVTTLRPNDLTQSLGATSVSTTSTTQAAQTNVTNTAITNQAVQNLLLVGDPSTQMAPGGGTWTQFGSLSYPLRRGDFLRIGDNSSLTWANVSGITVVIVVADATNINVGLYNMLIAGGYGPDAGVSGASPYDWRYTHYDPATGAESNPSPIMATANDLSPLRQSVLLTPTASGTSSYRQRFYRRGGTLPTDWYFVGANSTDGGNLNDELADTDIEAAATLAIDNDQPVTTVNTSGTVLYGQPLSAIWGPVQSMLLGCGDKYRPGFLYFSKPGLYDSWPAANFVEVCSPSEELMNGCVYGTQSYVFSRQGLYAIYPNLDSSGSVTVTPTACTHGLVSRWGLAVGSGAIWFVSDDGIYATTGDREVNLTDEKLYPLFHGVSVGNQAAVDYTTPTAIRLAVANNNLYFAYRGIDGAQHMLVYSILLKCWRRYEFNAPPRGLYAETLGSQLVQLLMGGNASGTTYTHTGTSDDGAAIPATIITGAQDQGAPRQDKLYAGDLAIDADLRAPLTVQALYNNLLVSGTTTTVATTGARARSFAKIFPGTALGRNIALNLSWSTSTTPCTLYWTGLSWIVDAIEHVHAETDFLDHGIPGWQVPTYFYATLRSTASVTLTVNTYADGGHLIASDTYTLATTGGDKHKVYQALSARRGFTFKYLLDSSAPFRIYWEMSEVGIVPWHRGKTAVVYPLGTEMPSPLTRFIHPDFESLRLGGD